MGAPSNETETADGSLPLSERGRLVGLDPSLADVFDTPLTVVDPGLETGRTATSVDRDGSSFSVPATDDAGVAVRVRREIELPGVDPFGSLAGLAVGAFTLGVLPACAAGLLPEHTPETVSQAHTVTRVADSLAPSPVTSGCYRW